jgi:hypothetical protein
MRNISRATIVAAVIAIGCGFAVNAYARGGSGAAGSGGHAAPSAGAASGHMGGAAMGSAPRGGAPTAASRTHSNGPTFRRLGNTIVPD